MPFFSLFLSSSCKFSVSYSIYLNIFTKIYVSFCFCCDGHIKPMLALILIALNLEIITSPK